MNCSQIYHQPYQQETAFTLVDAVRSYGAAADELEAATAASSASGTVTTAAIPTVAIARPHPRLTAHEYIQNIQGGNSFK